MAKPERPGEDAAAGNVGAPTHRAGALAGEPRRSFKALQGGAQLAFERVEVMGLPAVTMRTDAWGEEEADTNVLLDRLHPILTAALGEPFEEVALFNGGDARPTLAFAYREDQTVRGLELAGDDHWRAWLVALNEPFGTTTEHVLRRNQFSSSAFTGWASLLRDPARWAIKHAPESYRREEYDAEKERYFAFQPVAAAPAFDRGRFDAALRALLKAVDAQPTPARAQPLDRLERQVGAPLPGELRALYETTGGLKGQLHGFDLLSPAQIQAEWSLWQSVYSSFNLADLTDQYRADPGVHPVYVSPRWVPFVDLVGGHFVAVDLGPAPGGTYGQVIVFGRDVHNVRRVAPSLTGFLELAASYDGTEAHPLYGVFGRLRY